MNGRIFLQLTQRGVGNTVWLDPDAIVLIEALDGGAGTSIGLRDETYVRVDEDAATILAMTGATIVTPALTRPPGGG